MDKRLIGLIASLMLAVPAPAAAGVTISFTGGHSPTDGRNGNILTYSTGDLSVQASAWSLNGYSLTSSWLGQYSDGLGVTNGSEGSGVFSNSSAIDNSNGIDFVLLVFNQAVTLQSAVLTPYQIGWSSADNDATVSYANLADAYNAVAPTAIPLTSPVWSQLAADAYSVPGNSRSPYTTGLLPPSGSANVWLVAADAFGSDSSEDGFRLSSIVVNPSAVPEPSTWAMYILGFAAVGVAVRKRQRPTGKLLQIA